MTVVFRIRTSGGQELSFASREMFQDFVRSGDLSPDDFVYDGETGSWSPARTHPMVLDIQYELEAAAERAEEEAAGASSAPAAEDPTEAASAGVEAADVGGEVGQADGADGSTESEDPDHRLIGGPGLEFDLALTDQLTPEDERRAFLEQLEAERQGELDAGPSIRDSLADFTSDTLAPRHEAPPPRAPDRPPRPSRPESKRAARHAPQEGARSASKGDRGRGAAASISKPKVASSSVGMGRILLLFLLAVVLVGGGYVGYRLLTDDSEPVATDSQEAGSPSNGTADAEARVPAPTLPEAEPSIPAADPVEPEPAGGEPVEEAEPVREAVIPDTPAAIFERASERYLASTQARLRDLTPVPDVWPTGPYLTAPSDHPEVVDVWQDYRSTIRAVRQTDAARYGSAYEAALDDAAVTGDAQQERLDAALADFASSRALRDAHFDRVEALATAALQSHNALVEAEGLLLYDATGSTGVGEGIGQGTTGRNAEAQLLLDQVVELLGDALDADGEGPGSPENVRAWVWDGFLDAVTR